MTAVLSHADACARASTPACGEGLARRIARYRPAYRPAVALVANRHSRLADLAWSFPALLLALAVPRAGYDRARVCADVVAGAPLRALAAATQVPLWLRRLEPEALGAPVRPLPMSPVAGRQIMNHVPKSPKVVGSWLDAIAEAADIADDGIAVWIAREWRRRDKHTRRDKLKLLCLWAWYSHHVADDPCRVKRQWTADIGFATAADAADVWRQNVSLFVEMGDGKLSDSWLRACEIGGFSFVPLDRFAAVRDEARAMRHCVRTYGSYLAENSCRLWSIRRNGVRVATIELGLRAESPFPHVAEIKLRDNRRAPDGLWHLARAWLNSHEFMSFAPRFEYGAEPPARLDSWRRMWRPYWLSKRRIPSWLPLSYTGDAACAF
jgi:hypothetical protein